MNMDNAGHPGSPGGPARPSRAFRDAVFEDPKQFLLALLPLVYCVPWNPITSTINYEYQLHLAYHSRLIYGKQILATYGPLGFLGIPFFHPSTFWLLIASNLVVYGFLIVRLVAMARARGEARFGLWTCLVLLPTTFISVIEWAPILFVPYLLVLMYVFEWIRGGGKMGWGLAACYAVLMAFFTLMKLTFAPLVLAPILLCAVAEVWSRSIPKTAMIYAASVAGLWMLVGQSFENVGDFLTYSAQIVGGYKDGMGITLPRVAVGGVLIGLAQAILWLAATLAAWRIGKGATLLLSSVLFLVMYAAFLNGYTRGDAEHAIPCVLVTLSLWALLMPWIEQANPHPWRWPAAAAKLVVWPALFVPLIMWPLGMAAHPNLGQIVNRPVALGRLALAGTRPFRTYARSLQEKLETKPVPGIRGGRVDVPIGDTGIAAASGASLTLRPTVTSYSGYTPKLSRANANFLEDPRGPSAVLLGSPFSLDDKYPTIEDPFSWLSLLTHFRHVFREDADYALFERRAEPLASRLVPLGSRTAALGEEVTVPDGGGHAIWAEIDLNPNRAGRLVNAVFKPAPVYLTTTLDDGQVKVGRIVVLMAKAGFLLSPYADEATVFGSISGGDDGGKKPRLVKSLKLDDGPGQKVMKARRFFEKEATIRFFGLHLDPAAPKPAASP